MRRVQGRRSATLSSWIVLVALCAWFCATMVAGVQQEVVGADGETEGIGKGGVESGLRRSLERSARLLGAAYANSSNLASGVGGDAALTKTAEAFADLGALAEEAAEIGATAVSGAARALRAIALEEGLVEGGVSAAVTEWQLAAQQGHPRGHFTMAALHAFGLLGIERDSGAAWVHLHMAAVGGDAEAALALGTLLSSPPSRKLSWGEGEGKKGENVHRSCRGGAAFLSLAALNGGWKGVGAPPWVLGALGTWSDEEMAGAWSAAEEARSHNLITVTRVQAEGGSNNLNMALGAASYTGMNGMPRSLEEAAHYWGLHFEKGQEGSAAAISAAAMAHLYAEGLGVDRDDTTATLFATEAADLDSPAGKTALAILLLRGQTGKCSASDDSRAQSLLASAGVVTRRNMGDSDAHAALAVLHLSRGQAAIQAAREKSTHSTVSPACWSEDRVTRLQSMFPLDFGVVAKHVEAAATSNQRTAVFVKAMMHLHGLHYPKSCAMASMLLQFLAKNGAAGVSASEAARRFRRGDTLGATIALARASVAGNAEAQWNLAFLLDRSKPRPRATHRWGIPAQLAKPLILLTDQLATLLGSPSATASHPHSLTVRVPLLPGNADASSLLYGVPVSASSSTATSSSSPASSSSSSSTPTSSSSSSSSSSSTPSSLSASSSPSSSTPPFPGPRPQATRAPSLGEIARELDARTVRLLQAAASQHVLPALVLSATYEMEGWGLEKPEEHAALEKLDVASKMGASSSGDKQIVAEALFRLGEMHTSGSHATRDLLLAKRLLEEAASKDAAAMWPVAILQAKAYWKRSYDVFSLWIEKVKFKLLQLTSPSSTTTNPSKTANTPSPTSSPPPRKPTRAERLRESLSKKRPLSLSASIAQWAADLLKAAQTPGPERDRLYHFATSFQGTVTFLSSAIIFLWVIRSIRRAFARVN